MDGLWLFIVGILLLILITTKTVHHYADRKEAGWVPLGLVWFGLFLNFFMLFLLPIEVTQTKYQACLLHNLEGCAVPYIVISKEAMTILWFVTYWTLYFLVPLPICQSYCEAGQFTVFTKLKAAIRENILFYTVMVIIGIIIGGILIASGKFTTEGLLGLAIAGGNAWGLFLLMTFLGYALIELPKYYWLHSDDHRTLDVYQFNAIAYKDKLEDRIISKLRVMEQLKKWCEQLSKNDPYNKYLHEMIESCGPEYRWVKAGRGETNITFDRIVKLNSQLLSANHKVKAAKGLYENLLYRTFALEDRMYSKNNPEGAIRWTFDNRRTYPGKMIVERFIWIYFTWLHNVLLKSIAILCILMGLIVVWSETFFNISRRFGIDLSVLAQIFNSHRHTPWILQMMMITIPLMFITGCAYWTLFRLKLFNLYRLIPNQQSSASSLLFCTIYVSRITPAALWNLLLMLHDETKPDSSGFSVLQPMKMVPSNIMDIFDTYFPIILIVLCVGTYFNIYTRIINAICIDRFRKYVYNSEITSKQVAEGQILVQNEREKRIGQSQRTSLDIRIDKIRDKYAEERKGLLGSSGEDREMSSMEEGTNMNGEGQEQEDDIQTTRTTFSRTEKNPKVQCCCVVRTWCEDCMYSRGAYSPSFAVDILVALIYIWSDRLWNERKLVSPN
ncbi:hypothetical protein PROFUN_04165 [Planoprotostelium fungivorum]|uniref:Uncharacterized protein n=1 Tax=Planoprotostelium fungivorum TaxID=1890364 RepID=A0A2P6NVT7_9EUKA|nr:hypothetical protein PROFUN_04165 [Planoprotostelium fungivorum]